jgi:lysylphosphatidylglycerol synthetase-like protein (DUF2156 family)
MKVGQTLVIVGTLGILALFVLADNFAPAELWHFDGPVAYVGRTFIGMAVLGVAFMIGARLLRELNFP